MASPLPKGSLCLHWLFKKLSPQIYYFFPNPLPFPEEMFWEAKDYSYLCTVSPRQASSQCSNRARRFLFMPPAHGRPLRPLPNDRNPRDIETVNFEQVLIIAHLLTTELTGIEHDVFI